MMANLLKANNLEATAVRILQDGIEAILVKAGNINRANKWFAVAVSVRLRRRIDASSNEWIRLCSGA